MTAPQPVIGLLHAGEMGTALATLLIRRGLRVITTCAGRSQATVARCEAHGIECLPDLHQVARQANVVLSVVLPDAAESVAVDYTAHAHFAPANALYVDLNSIQPATTQRIGRRLRAAGIDFVDAAVNGLARNAGTSSTLFLSGPRAGEIAAIFAGSMRTDHLGGDIGQASAMKMLLGGVSKGVCALMLELLLGADARGMLPDFTQAVQRIYPGIWELVDRMLPTYALHAGRRATETNALGQTICESGIDTEVVSAVHRLHAALATIVFDPAARQGIADFIEHLPAVALRNGEPHPTQTEAARL